jgi:hypothetical protein
VGIGIGMRALYRLRIGVVISLAVALLAALWSVQKISLSPLKLTPRSLEMATASTHVVVDTPSSMLIDLRQDTYNLDGLKNRSVLLANVIASTPVRQRIARDAGVPVERLRIQPPLTREQSAPAVDSENAKKTSDILKSADQYRIVIQANPTVPMLDVYAQTPDADTAATLVNAAVHELRGYLEDVAAEQRTPGGDQIKLIQLGEACSATTIFVARVRAGWRLAVLTEDTAAG